MNKKCLIIIVIIILVIPIKIDRLKDGGTSVYNGFIYKITKYHMLSEKSSTGYIDGLKFELFGLTIYDKLNYYEDSNNINNEDISLYIKNDTLDYEGATFILKNNTDKEYWYGPEYSIEVKIDGKWSAIPLKEPLVWNSIVYSLGSHEEKEININWAITSYGILKNGRYRLVKNLTNKINNEKIIVYAEFEIE